MKLLFKDKFSLDTEINGTEKTIPGTFAKLTKLQETDIKKKFKKELGYIEELTKLSQKANRIQLKQSIDKDNNEINNEAIELFDRVNELREIIEKSDTKEAMAKYRFELSVESDDLKDLISICEAYGYSEVINAISEDVSNKGK